ncbi:MAG: glycine zipper 2TM domain-containing protein [Sedimenticola sp.]
MKKTIIMLALSLAFASGSALADNSYYDTASVLKAKPIYETVRVNQPEERCWNESVRHRGGGRSHSYTPTITGAIIGGVVGNRFGRGSGKDAMTVAGALLGGSIGNDLGKRPSRGYVTQERRCETVDHYQEQEELVGYRVKYSYNGKTYWTRMASNPGRSLKVRVSVEPSIDSSDSFQGYDWR